MAYCLRYKGRDFKLLGTLTVGRGEGCTIVVDDPLVSRTHATVTFEGGRVVVEDLRSRNGVTLNGALIDGTATVKLGDRVGIGAEDLVLVDAEARELDDDEDEHTVATSRFTNDTPPVSQPLVSQPLAVDFVTIGGHEYAVIPKEVYLRTFQAPLSAKKSSRRR